MMTDPNGMTDPIIDRIIEVYISISSIQIEHTVIVWENLYNVMKIRLLIPKGMIGFI